MLIKGKGLGCIEIEREPDPQYGNAWHLFGAGSLPLRASLADRIFIPSGYPFADQETNQECVGWMGTQLVHIRSSVLGFPMTPSPGGVYFGARARRYGWNNVWDGGCNPHEAFEHCREGGLIPYHAWPHSTRTVNDHPDPGCYRKAADNKWMRPHWVLQQYRTPIVKPLLAAGFPVGFATMVGNKLSNWRPGDAPWEVEHGGGGHAMTIVGYDTYGPRSEHTVFIVANSWGNIHDHGFFIMSESALESPLTRYVCTVDLDLEKIA